MLELWKYDWRLATKSLIRPNIVRICWVPELNDLKVSDDAIMAFCVWDLFFHSKIHALPEHRPFDYSKMLLQEQLTYV